MRELITLGIVSALFFITFMVTLVTGLIKKNRFLKIAAFVSLTCFFASAAWTGFRFLQKSYNQVAESLKPRTGTEIYSALFGPDQHGCVTVTNSQDQVIPKIDYAIWLRFETCPAELKRILAIHEFSNEKTTWSDATPYGENIDWVNLQVLGDTILAFDIRAKIDETYRRFGCRKTVRR